MEDLIIGQNTSLPYRIYITNNDQQITLDDVSKVEITIGKLRKVYTRSEPDENFYYSLDDKCFYLLLTETETRSFKDQVPVQIRVQFLDKTVQSSCIQYINVRRALSQVSMSEIIPISNKIPNISIRGGGNA